MSKKVFKNDLFEVTAALDDGQILFDAEQVARSLGITDKKNDVEYVRWNRVNSYLPKDSPQVAKGDLIPEPMVYKLAFKAQNEVAEKFQDWLAVDVIPQIRKTGSYSIDTSQLSPELQAFNSIFQTLANQELATKKLETKVDGIRDVVALSTVNWREDARALINKIAQSLGGGGAYREVTSQVYKEIERRGGYQLGTRLTNKRRRLADEGVSKSRRDKLTKVDVIADDKRLIEIYVAVVKEFAIKYGVEVGEGA